MSYKEVWQRERSFRLRNETGRDLASLGRQKSQMGLGGLWWEKIKVRGSGLGR